MHLPSIRGVQRTTILWAMLSRSLGDAWRDLQTAAHKCLDGIFHFGHGMSWHDFKNIYRQGLKNCRHDTSLDLQSQSSGGLTNLRSTSTLEGLHAKLLLNISTSIDFLLVF